MGDVPVVLRGSARRPGGEPAAAVVTLGTASFDVAVGPDAPWSAAYRDLALVAVDGGVALVVVGESPDGAAADPSRGDRWLFEGFGERLGRLVRGLRDGRLRQWLADGLVEADAGVAIELVEYATGEETGVAQILYHGRGVALAPLDERCPRRTVRRADIGAVALRPEVGGVRVERVARRGRAGGTPIDLLRLGPAASAHRDRWAALRDGAATDAAAIVAGLIPDASPAIRSRVASRLVEGRAVGPADVGDGWAPLERAVLAEPTFAESYRALVELAGEDPATRWLAAAPREPGAPEDPLLWSLVALPGNLVALELVSGGAHATYFFRVVPRRAYDGRALREAGTAVDDVSEALIDARFLREPMALPAARLAEPAYLRYRLALAALPSLAAARRRFVARIVHADAVTWRAAVEDLIAWHEAARDDEAEWPGRGAQETMVDEAAAGG